MESNDGNKPLAFIKNDAAEIADRLYTPAADLPPGVARVPLKEVHLNRAPLNLYTVPEAAGIGLTESQARRRGEVMIGRCPLSLNTRAVACGQTEGFVKVIADRAYGEILGVHIVGGMATEMIVEAKTMMDMEITVYEVCDIMHAHPTWSEAFMEACADAIGESMSTGPKRG